MGGENFALGAGGLDASGSSPHGRGKPGLSCPSTLVVGSSPHGRGKRVECGDEPCGRGLIPAWTGKTSRASTWPTTGASHPRMDGENLMRWRVSGPATGLSPRGRGKQTIEEGDFLVFRLIRARAGKTEQSSGQPHSWPAHPRAGGENDVSACSRSARAGSSPRGRGKRGFVDTNRHVEGLIPARAGKTAPCRSPNPANQAHPRAGGEN